MTIGGTLSVTGAITAPGGLTTTGTVTAGVLTATKLLTASTLEINTGGGHTILNTLSGGNVGIGTSMPTYKLDVYGPIHTSDSLVVDSNLTSKGNLTVTKRTKISSLGGTGYSMVVADANGNLYPLSFAGPVGNPLPPSFGNCYNWSTCGNSFLPGDQVFLGTNTANDMILGAGGNPVMWLTQNGNALFQGAAGVSIGSAATAGLSYGNGYVGFNASHDVATGSFSTTGDGSHNGGGVIWSNMVGNMYFAPIGTTGGTAQTGLSDATVARNAALSILPTSGQTQVYVSASGSIPLNSTLWTSNSSYSYGFGVDAAGIGHIYENSATPTNIFTFNQGNVGIGTNTITTGYKLSVGGSIRSIEVKVEPGWSDYVFEKSYKLRSIETVKQFISDNGHLPEVPTAAEVAKNGVNVGETEALLLKKIEELTLYIIQLKEDNIEIKKTSEELKKKVSALEGK